MRCAARKVHCLIGGGPFYYEGDFMVKESAYDKPFLTYKEQIQLLRSRGLRIDNDAFAIHALSTLSYYDIINRYKKIFMSDDDRFTEPISIEYLYDFRLLDLAFQSVIIKYSVIVENIFKTRFAYVLSEKCGVDKNGYLDKKYFRQKKGNLCYDNVAFEIDQYINKRRPMPTEYYKTSHNHIPAWILFKNVSFSNTINLYKLLLRDLQNEVSESLIPNDLPREQKIELISTTLNAIRLLRNVAAHNLHFTSFELTKKQSLSHNFLYKVVGSPLLSSSRSSSNAASVQGVYGVILSILCYLQIPYLQAAFVEEFIVFLVQINDISPEKKRETFSKYIQAIGVPQDILFRFNDHLKKIGYQTPDIYKQF